MEKLLRIEKDFLGEKEIDSSKYYGIQTLRAKENFNITKTDISLFPNFIKSLAKVKKACALTNYELGDLSDMQKDAIIQACNEIIDGKFHDQFIVDPIQGGAGTSTNMNANEVIANRALEILGKPKSSYDVIHPNNHINMSQSTNDVYPTAIKITLHELIFKLKDSLLKPKKWILLIDNEYKKDLTPPGGKYFNIKNEILNENNDIKKMKY